METKKTITATNSKGSIEITFKAIDWKDIKKNQTICEEHCSLNKICGKIVNPDSDLPESSFNEFCRDETCEELSIGVVLVPEITEEEAINLIGLKDV